MSLCALWGWPGSRWPGSRGPSGLAATCEDVTSLLHGCAAGSFSKETTTTFARDDSVLKRKTVSYFNFYIFFPLRLRNKDLQWQQVKVMLYCYLLTLELWNVTCGDCIPDKRGSGSPEPPVLDPEVEPEVEQEVNILTRSHLGRHELAFAPYALFVHSSSVLKILILCLTRRVNQQKTFYVSLEYYCICVKFFFISHDSRNNKLTNDK